MRRLLVLAAALASVAWAPVPHNPANRYLNVPMDPLRYDYATHCVKHAAPGALKLQAWLERNVRGVSWGILRCEMWGPHSASLHAEGRAVDWHLDSRVPSDRRAAENLIHLLLAPDKAGNEFALARRMGVQEIIWNCHAWFGGGESLTKYSVCYTPQGKRRKHVDPTAGHENHVHIGLNLRGARARTSFWTHRR